MALELGTNCGFVTEAPVDDPSAAGTGGIDTWAYDIKDTSPATAAKITEVGWYCDNATEAADFDVALYAADGEVVPGEAGNLLYSDTANAKGTDAGWKKVTVDWEISANTVYWIAVRLNDTETQTNIDAATSGGSGWDTRSAATELRDPFDGGDIYDPDGMPAIYAVWEASVPLTLKPVSAAYINIGDVWKKAF